MSDMLIPPARKRYDELLQRLREIRSRSGSEPTPEIVAIEEEIQHINEQLASLQTPAKPVLKG